MIELSWRQIRDTDLSAALNGLARQRVPYSVTLKLLTIVKVIEAEQKKADAVAQALLEKYMKKVEKEVDGKKTLVWEMKNKKHESQLKKEEQDFLSTKFKIRASKIKSSELMSASISAVELFKIEDLIEFDTDERPLPKPSRLKSVESNA